jgi:hypothetical protein
MNYPAGPINRDRVSILILLKDTESFLLVIPAEEGIQIPDITTLSWFRNDMFLPCSKLQGIIKLNIINKSNTFKKFCKFLFIFFSDSDLPAYASSRYRSRRGEHAHEPVNSLNIRYL